MLAGGRGRRWRWAAAAGRGGARGGREGGRKKRWWSSLVIDKIGGGARVGRLEGRKKEEKEVVGLTRH